MYSQRHKPAALGQKRFLNVHEYISMGLMKEYGVSVPAGAVASSPAEAEAVAAKMLAGGDSGECGAKVPNLRH